MDGIPLIKKEISHLIANNGIILEVTDTKIISQPNGNLHIHIKVIYNAR